MNKGYLLKITVQIIYIFELLLEFDSLLSQDALPTRPFVVDFFQRRHLSMSLIREMLVPFTQSDTAVALLSSR